MLIVLILPARFKKTLSYISVQKKNNRYNSLRVNTDTHACRAFRAVGGVGNFSVRAVTQSGVRTSRR